MRLLDWFRGRAQDVGQQERTSPPSPEATVMAITRKSRAHWKNLRTDQGDFLSLDITGLTITDTGPLQTALQTLRIRADRFEVDDQNCTHLIIEDEPFVARFLGQFSGKMQIDSFNYRTARNEGPDTEF